MSYSQMDVPFICYERPPFKFILFYFCLINGIIAILDLSSLTNETLDSVELHSTSFISRFYFSDNESIIGGTES